MIMMPIDNVKNDPDWRRFTCEQLKTPRNPPVAWAQWSPVIQSFDHIEIWWWWQWRWWWRMAMTNDEWWMTNDEWRMTNDDDDDLSVKWRDGINSAKLPSSWHNVVTLLTIAPHLDCYCDNDDDDDDEDDDDDDDDDNDDEDNDETWIQRSQCLFSTITTRPAQPWQTNQLHLWILPIYQFDQSKSQFNQSGYCHDVYHHQQSTSPW